MSKALSAFQPVGPFDGIYVAHKGNLRCTAIRLASGGLCLYSPVQGLGPIARDSLDSIGEVTHLLAPNHYHNKALVAYSEHFPVAQICSTEAANPRLEKITGLTIESLKGLSKRLPTGMTFIKPQGHKAWVFEQIEHDRPTLIIPCHGSIIRDSKLAIKLEKLVARI